MNKNFSSDKPVNNINEDKFQRYNFSKRIANTIIERENDDCIVIGIYGAWGEGKTSVINFIENELKLDENIISIKFNPWRYQDENSLLKEFFEKLAKTFDVNLSTNRENIGELIKKYGKLLSFDIPVIGNVGDSVSNAGELLSEVDLETLKERIEKIIIDHQKKIVIFIDDIDRLDKNEIHSIFRLVKLTADFKNTIYILSFDEEMVSSAIGERFGSGNQISGQNFLEKIIQVPLKIPVAQPNALKEFCFKLVDKAIESNQIILTQEDINRFVYHFTHGVLVKLETPRLAVRYGNSLSFSLTLLYEEVNIVDLMLIEAIKIFYPNYYQFIKSNSDYFIGNEFQFSTTNNNDNKSNILDEQFDNLGIEITNKQKQSIENLIKELFPKANKNNFNDSFLNNKLDEWYINKRIVSPRYFNRYFSYTVIKGEISDVEFKIFIENLLKKNKEDIITNLQKIISQSSHDNFLHKLRSFQEKFDWETSKKIIDVMSSVTEIFPSRDRGFFLSFRPAKNEVVFLIYDLFKLHKNEIEKFIFAKKILAESSQFELAYDLIEWFLDDIDSNEKLFNDKENLEFEIIIRKKALDNSGDIPLFEKYPEEAQNILNNWAFSDKKNLDSYIKKILNKEPSKCVLLIKCYTPTATSTAVVGPYKTDFSKDQYQHFIKIFDKNFINKNIEKIYSKKQLVKDEVHWSRRSENSQNDLNIIRQFKYWYDEELKQI